jgi:hypothetical protein
VIDAEGAEELGSAVAERIPDDARTRRDVPRERDRSRELPGARIAGILERSLSLRAEELLDLEARAGVEGEVVEEGGAVLEEETEVPREGAEADAARDVHHLAPGAAQDEALLEDQTEDLRVREAVSVEVADPARGRQTSSAPRPP